MRFTDLRARYEAACADTSSDIYEHLPEFVDTVVALSAQRVIELGVRRGVSTVAWLWGLGHTQGHLWSVDIIAPPPPLRANRWTFVQGDDLDQKVLDQLPEQVDIVFVDTSHSFLHTLGELRAYVPRVRSGGCVFLHDTAVEYPDDVEPGGPRFPVAHAIADYCAETGLAWSNVAACYGLGRIDVP